MKNVFFIVLAVIICSGCPDYFYLPLWTKECENIEPFTAKYNLCVWVCETVVYDARILDIRYEKVGDVSIFIKVIKVEKVYDPTYTDPCYESLIIKETLTGKTNNEGKFCTSFFATYTAAGDYYILDSTAEKAGYYMDATSKEEKYVRVPDLDDEVGENYYYLPGSDPTALRERFASINHNLNKTNSEP